MFHTPALGSELQIGTPRILQKYLAGNSPSFLLRENGRKADGKQYFFDYQAKHTGKCVTSFFFFRVDENTQCFCCRIFTTALFKRITRRNTWEATNHNRSPSLAKAAAICCRKEKWWRMSAGLQLLPPKY